MLFRTHAPIKKHVPHAKRKNASGASCCGRKEYIKLYAYTLVQHPIAVVLDLDSLILQPFDGLFDAMLSEDDDMDILDMKERGRTVPVHISATNLLPAKKRRIEAFYTRDYNMVNAGGERYTGIQG